MYRLYLFIYGKLKDTLTLNLSGSHLEKRELIERGIELLKHNHRLPWDGDWQIYLVGSIE